MNPIKPSYDDLSAAVLTVHGQDLTSALLEERCLSALVELGIFVRVGGGMIETTTHGERVHRRLKSGERIKEFEPESPYDWSK